MSPDWPAARTTSGGAHTFDESIRYENLLIDFDQLHPIGPDLYAMTGGKAELLDWLEGSVDQMLGLGGDGLSLELLLLRAMAQDDADTCG